MHNHAQLETLPLWILKCGCQHWPCPSAASFLKRSFWINQNLQVLRNHSWPLDYQMTFECLPETAWPGLVSTISTPYSPYILILPGPIWRPFPSSRILFHIFASPEFLSLQLILVSLITLICVSVAHRSSWGRHGTIASQPGTRLLSLPVGERLGARSWPTGGLVKSKWDERTGKGAQGCALMWLITGIRRRNKDLEDS